MSLTYIFGTFNFGTFRIGGDVNHMCIVQSLGLKRTFETLEEAEHFIDVQPYDSWCRVDDQIEIVYSENFVLSAGVSV
ncbi:hypothetical protein [Methylotenera sp.]|uniref:hypothetical protein n=1 Tax=Methylotenera sp. TaxID=2051956 RepID=UPI0024886907|nr:hypothetical protein [Methylotenera sp.]MDI1362538.1 hypothetical protein [Methylotenera sp.]